MQPNIISILLGSSSCVEVDGTSYIKEDKRYKCFDEEHMKYMYMIILPAMLFWGILIPLMIFLDLYRNRKNFNNLKIRFMYGYLF